MGNWRPPTLGDQSAGKGGNAIPRLWNNRRAGAAVTGPARNRARAFHGPVECLAGRGGFATKPPIQNSQSVERNDER